MSRDASLSGIATLDRLVDDEDDVAIAAISVAELAVGVELADDDRRAARKAFVAAVLEAVSIESSPRQPAPREREVVRFRLGRVRRVA